MRTFLRTHWKVLVAIFLLVVLALFTVNPGATVPGIPLASRLRAHVTAIAAGGHGMAMPSGPERAARYIEEVLRDEGYAIRRRQYPAGGSPSSRLVRNIEASVSNLAAGARPARIFLVGARYDPAPDDGKGGGTAAVLELARLLKDLRPSRGTEVRFVFLVDEEPSGSGGKALGGANFIAYAGSQASSYRVRDALSAFRATSDLPSHGLAVPAYVQGVTLSGCASCKQAGYPALMIADTAFMRYPYYKMTANDAAGDPPDPLDYEVTARVLQGLARTLMALAAGAQG
jgi:hypothetical protein